MILVTTKDHGWQIELDPDNARYRYTGQSGSLRWRVMIGYGFADGDLIIVGKDKPMRIPSSRIVSFDVIT